MYIVSKCLLGYNCKYNGGNNASRQVIDFCKEHTCIPVCPESAGGLPCPRPPAERIGEKIVDREGQDVTEQFVKGAELCLDHCIKESKRRGEDIQGAILKANSPSCGFGNIYDGTFTGTLTEGHGVFAKRLADLDIKVITEKEKIQW